MAILAGMRRILRGLRRRLPGERDVRAYLAYAVGEVVLVVIGILVAIQLNAWNGRRVARAENRALLRELLGDLRSDRTRLDALTTNRLGTDLGGWNTLDTSVYYCRRALRWSSAEPTWSRFDSMFAHRLDSGAPIIGTETSVYDQLRSTGRLYALGSDSLRRRITAYYRMAEREETYNAANNREAYEALRTLAVARRIRLQRARDGALDTVRYAWLRDNGSEEMLDLVQALRRLEAVQGGNSAKMKALDREAGVLIAAIERELGG